MNTNYPPVVFEALQWVADNPEEVPEDYPYYEYTTRELPDYVAKWADFLLKEGLIAGVNTWYTLTGPGEYVLSMVETNSGKTLAIPKYRPTENEYSVLHVLRHAESRLKVDEIADRTNISPKTCGHILRALADRELVDYDPKKRRGAEILAAGQEIVMGQSSPPPEAS